MGDLIFVAVVVAFFAVTVAYVKGLERIVGSDAGVVPDVDPTEGAGSPLGMGTSETGTAS